MGITRRTRTVSQKFFTSTEGTYGNYGSICFSITEVTDTNNEDGTVKVYNSYSKEDGRCFTDVGRRYFIYDDVKKFNAANKRVARTAAENNLVEEEVLTWG